MIFAQFTPALVLLGLLPLGSKAFDFKEAINSATNNIKDFVESVEAVKCTASHADEFKQCMADFQNKKKEVGESETKEYCCAYIRYSDCVEDVAKQHCGDKASAIVDSYMNAIKDIIMSEECQSYNSWWDCMNNTLLIIVILAIFLIVGGIVFYVFCYGRRRPCY